MRLSSTLRWSIRARLMVHISAILFATWSLIGALILTESSQEFTELSRGKNAQIAAAIANVLGTELAGGARSETKINPLTLKGAEDYFVVITRGDELVYETVNAPSIAVLNQKKNDQILIGQQTWIVEEQFVQSSDLRVFSGRQQLEDDLFALDMAVSVAVPSFIAFFFVITATFTAIHNGLKPLRDLARAIGKRTPSQRGNVNLADIPSELTTVVKSLNALFKEQAAHFDKEKRFVADASHELKTPLTAAKAQLQAIMKSRIDKRTSKRVESSIAAINRLSQLVSQFLLLAETEQAENVRALQEVDLYLVSQRAVADCYTLARQKSIELELVGEPLKILADEPFVEIMVRNIVENAIVHTPRRTTVLVSIVKAFDRAIIKVEDDGNGIPPEEYEHIFNRFAKVLGSTNESGSGLGLAIVKTIAERNNAEVRASKSTKLGGLSLAVEFSALN